LVVNKARAFLFPLKNYKTPLLLKNAWEMQAGKVFFLGWKCAPSNRRHAPVRQEVCPH